MKKLTYEYVKQYFKDNNCILLESEYINNGSKMKYICMCGEQSTINFNSFKSGKRCKSCGIIKIKNKIKYTENDIKLLFSTNNCELLSEYVNYDTPVIFKCKCDNISKIRVKDFRKSKQCNKCGYKSMSINRCHTQEYISNQFKINGCELLSNYNNVMEKVKYKCVCGNISEITYNNFKKGSRCKLCKISNLSKLNRKNQTDVEEFFLNNNCELLDIYKNNKLPMKYKCECGNISYIRFDVFIRGGRCNKCALQKLSSRMTGSNNPMYKNDRNKIKSIRQLRLRSTSIIKKYRKRYNIKTNNYHIDHIFPIYAFVEHNILNLDLINCDENLQILTKMENCRKKNIYNKDEFYKWLETKGVIINA